VHHFLKGDSDYIARIFFDLSFFIVVGVVLFNVITGLMVDGFGALRDEANERAEVNYSIIFFVCIFNRSVCPDSEVNSAGLYLLRHSCILDIRS
jgi:hypothetical protein